MKFSKNNTCLHFLEAKKPEEIDFALPDREEGLLNAAAELETYYGIRNSIFEATKLFRDRIQFVSDPFLNAFEKARGKIAPLFKTEPINQTGTMMFRGNKHTTTIFYYVDSNGVEQDWKADIAVFVFLTIKDREGTQNQLVAVHTHDSKKEKMNQFSSKDLATLGFDAVYWLKFVIHFLTFCKYCEVETKIVQPNRKERHVGEQYKNETPKSIEVLDATWFTTIVRSVGFTVGAQTGGFFRWQPYGPGQIKRRLQWIMPFEKEGYTRKAKVLLHGTTDVKGADK